ncbi:MULTISPECIES: SH3 domain-containing protein [Terrisporobacter]|uniref:SH3 domain-containing protein n=1 Tax=Terrisporobacter TaxID=1505652 RepID=UPI00068DAC06|nr:MULTISPECIES: SH3 domain-containing protein [Terrisporobacter]MCC3670063.1 SH3 domain-containing protein [Terrisporobacter mayombei]MDU6983364.1 SH3 domain-containing protein [Terrisporobacter othiniensis]
MIKKTIRTMTLTAAMMLTVSAFAPINKVDAANVTGTVTANVLNVRSGASTSYSVVGKVSKGEKVEILSSNDGWYKIEYDNNQTGWSCDDYITKNTVTGTVTANVLNVRSGASTSYSIVGKLSKGEKVEILLSNNGWHKIQYSQDNTGWVCDDYVSTSSASSSSNSSSSVVKTLNVKAYAYTGDGITATGTVPKYGTIAVDPSVIPYGTKVYIKELDKVFTAEDTGGAIKGNTIDIFMPTEKNCNDWGIRNITIEILK